MASLLSNLVNNFAEVLQKIKCKDCDCLLKYKSVKKNLIKYKCFYQNINLGIKII